ncbi:hypothetical protein HMPREF9099_01527 [Lachnospiraceae bacterium oral taxon 082 str. F0431]|nr:hypothetical protein HMPREF9099_01527 [Lachnospiraceae bacterium oral taxon 082 str. F0431]
MLYIIPDLPFAKSKDSLIQGFDSAAAFSAYFNLQPGESKSATFEVSMRVSVYYVDPTYGDQNGASTGYITKALQYCTGCYRCDRSKWN